MKRIKDGKKLVTPNIKEADIQKLREIVNKSNSFWNVAVSSYILGKQHQIN